MAMAEIRALEYRDGCLRLLDQRKLPGRIEWIECRDYQTVAEAIRTLAVRGAPAIGLAAGYGSVLGCRQLMHAGLSGKELRRHLLGALDELRGTRPTAVNLFWALDRMRRCIETHEDESPDALCDALTIEADEMMREDEAANRSMSAHGRSLIRDGANILTHCNTGALVSSALGTALGVVRGAWEEGKQVHVWVDETRPLLQGARLTAWELQQIGIPHTVITDGMAAHFMSRGRVDLAIVGADRIARNGDTANKIGTYGVAVLARAHGIPFYVVAPTSTVDLSLPDGNAIAIEERRQEEVLSLHGVQIAPSGSRAANPAFDVTPAHLISAIVTEAGVAAFPYEDELVRHCSAARTEMAGPG